MNTSSNQTSALAYTERLSRILTQLDHAAIDKGVALIESTWKAGKQIITLGNGGSSLTA